VRPSTSARTSWRRRRAAAYAILMRVFALLGLLFIVFGVLALLVNSVSIEQAGKIGVFGPLPVEPFTIPRPAAVVSIFAGVTFLVLTNWWVRATTARLANRP
jgi:hypothetical protein